MCLAILALVLGFGISLLSGFLGIGGGILMAPALLYLPQALGIEGLDMATVSGLTISQGLFASASGGLRHDRYGVVSRRLVLWMGPSIAASAMLGAFMSSSISNRALMSIFAGLALAAAALMLLPRGDDREIDNAQSVPFNVSLAVAIAVVVGFLGGMVGQGGSFLLIPLMIHALRLPTRVAIGSNLGIVIFASAAGFVGKLSTHQIPGLLAVFLVAGALPGAQLGSVLSVKTHPRWLRRALALIIVMTAIGITADTCGGSP